MRGSSTTIYIVAAIIIFHFIAGFIYLFIKMSPKRGEKKNPKNNLYTKNDD